MVIASNLNVISAIEISASIALNKMMTSLDVSIAINAIAMDVIMLVKSIFTHANGAKTIGANLVGSKNLKRDDRSAQIASNESILYL